jgi:NitT/TauT family transport system permease protein
VASQAEPVTDAADLAAARGVTRRPRDFGRVLQYVLPLLVVLAFLFIWQYVPLWLGIPTYELPNLSATVSGLQADWADIGTGLLITLQDAVVGFLIGNALAVLGATIFAFSVNSERAFYPVAILIQTVPIIVYVPLLRILFFKTAVLDAAPDAAAVVAVTVLICFFPTLVNMTVGFKSVDPRVLELMRLLNASRMQIFLKVRFPSAIPFLFSSLKITSTLAFVGAIVGEWMAASGFNPVGQALDGMGAHSVFGFETNPANGAGIGNLLSIFQFKLDKPGIFASVLAVSILSMLFFGLMVLLERLLVPWRQTQ